MGAARKNKQAKNQHSVLLYDISQDPKETKNLAEQKPELVEKMSTTLTEWRKSILNSLDGKDYPVK